jgi:vacuolar-type H+-ATPase subunit F/Vma7
MWSTKVFKTEDELKRWIKKNQNKFQYEIIYINNGYAVEYRKLKRIY